MPPIAVYLGAVLVNQIADARIHAIRFSDLFPVLVGLWITVGVQRAIGAYMGYGRNLFVRRVQLEPALVARSHVAKLSHPPPRPTCAVAAALVTRVRASTAKPRRAAWSPPGGVLVSGRGNDPARRGQCRHGL